MSTHFLIFGATGPLGQVFVKDALEKGHTLTIYVRNAAKLPTEVKDSPNVTVVEGQLTDEPALATAVNSGATVCISFLGPTPGSKGTPITDGVRILIPLLISAHYTRAFIWASPVYIAPEDAPSLSKWSLARTFIKLVGGTAFKEFSGLGPYVSTIDTKQLKWTIVRVPFLDDGPAKKVVTTFTGMGDDTLHLTRKAVPAWIYEELREEKWVGKAPLLCN